MMISGKGFVQLNTALKIIARSLGGKNSSGLQGLGELRKRLQNLFLLITIVHYLFS